MPLQSREAGSDGSTCVTSARLNDEPGPGSLRDGVETVSPCVSVAANPEMEPMGAASLWEGVEVWLVSVSSVSWAEEGEELQGDDGQQESQEQLV